MKMSVGEIRALVRESLESLSEAVTLGPQMAHVVDAIKKADAVLGQKVNIFFSRLVSNRISADERDQMVVEIRQLIEKTGKYANHLKALFDRVYDDHLEASSSDNIADMIQTTLKNRTPSRFTMKSVLQSNV
jgi:hypothetical protein